VEIKKNKDNLVNHPKEEKNKWNNNNLVNQFNEEKIINNIIKNTIRIN
jgi:hypothetical protein